MSQQETVIGKLVLVDTDDYEKYAKEVLIVNGDKLLPISCLEQLLEYYSDEYMIINDELYHNVIDFQTSDDPNFCVVNPSDNGFTYATSFYNGGTWMTEMIEDELKRQNFKVNE